MQKSGSRDKYHFIVVRGSSYLLYSTNFSGYEIFNSIRNNCNAEVEALIRFN